MKELLLYATLDDERRAATPADLCPWLLLLTGDSFAGSPADAPMLYRSPCPEVLEVWLKESSSPQVAVYSRIAFRPLPWSSVPPSLRASAAGGAGRLIAVELLPPMQVYVAQPLSQMGLVGADPQWVTTDGRVVPYDSLTPQQLMHIDSSYAILTPRLAACLGLPFRGGRRALPEGSPYERLQQTWERLLPRCFPTGGEVQGCPLHLSLLPVDVPESRLVVVDEAHRQLSFGNGGRELSPRRGLELHGACLPSQHRSLPVVMLYPRGQEEAARRLFGLLGPLCRLVAVRPTGDVKEWIAYDAGESAISQLTRALYSRPTDDEGAASRVYCYVTPGGDADAALARGRCAVRLRGLIHSFGSIFVGPVPLHAIRPEGFGRQLPSVASRLLLRLGGVPWVPSQPAGQDTDLIAALSMSGTRQGIEPFCAATFYNDPLQFCRHDLCRPTARFSLFFAERFRSAYAEFCAGHKGCAPRRLVVYCHHDLPLHLFQEFVHWMAGFGEAVPVVLVRVRHTAGDALRHYDAAAPGCLPAAGTCVRCDDSRFLLFCRPGLPASGSRRGFYPAPTEVSLHLLEPGGGLLPLPPGEVEATLVQACQLVWANPASVDGSPLPLVLWHTDRLVRHRCQEWQAEVAARIAISGGTGNVAM